MVGVGELDNCTYLAHHFHIKHLVLTRRGVLC